MGLRIRLTSELIGVTKAYRNKKALTLSQLIRFPSLKYTEDEGSIGNIRANTHPVTPRSENAVEIEFSSWVDLDGHPESSKEFVNPGYEHFFLDIEDHPQISKVIEETNRLDFDTWDIGIRPLEKYFLQGVKVSWTERSITDFEVYEYN